jgi:hypothetical protein
MSTRASGGPSTAPSGRWPALATSWATDDEQQPQGLGDPIVAALAWLVLFFNGTTEYQHLVAAEIIVGLFMAGGIGFALTTIGFGIAAIIKGRQENQARRRDEHMGRWMKRGPSTWQEREHEQRKKADAEMIAELEAELARFKAEKRKRQGPRCDASRGVTAGATAYPTGGRTTTRTIVMAAAILCGASSAATAAGFNTPPEPVAFTTAWLAKCVPIAPTRSFSAGFNQAEVQAFCDCAAHGMLADFTPTDWREFDTPRVTVMIQTEHKLCGWVIRCNRHHTDAQCRGMVRSPDWDPNIDPQ